MKVSSYLNKLNIVIKKNLEQNKYDLNKIAKKYDFDSIGQLNII